MENLPKSENYFINERNQYLHFRYFLPAVPVSEIGSIIFYIHGYGGHVNRPVEFTKLSEILCKSSNIALFGLDLVG